MLKKDLNKFRNIIKHAINFILFDLLLIITEECIIEEFFSSVEYSWWILGITTVIGLTIYILLMSKILKKVFRTSISVIITSIIILLLSLLIDALGVPVQLIALILSLLMLGLVILAKISEIKKLKIEKYMKVVIKEIIYVFKFSGAVLISLVVGVMLQGLIEIYGIIVPITVIGLYLLNCIFNRLGKEEIDKEEEVKIQSNTIGFYILIILAIIGIIAIGYSIIGIIWYMFLYQY